MQMRMGNVKLKCDQHEIRVRASMHAPPICRAIKKNKYLAHQMTVANYANKCVMANMYIRRGCVCVCGSPEKHQRLKVSRSVHAEIGTSIIMYERNRYCLLDMCVLYATRVAAF